MSGWPQLLARAAVRIRVRVRVRLRVRVRAGASCRAEQPALTQKLLLLLLLLPPAGIRVNPANAVLHSHLGLHKMAQAAAAPGYQGETEPVLDECVGKNPHPDTHSDPHPNLKYWTSA